MQSLVPSKANQGLTKLYGRALQRGRMMRVVSERLTRAYCGGTVMSFGDCSQGALGQISQGGDSYEPATVHAVPHDIVCLAAGHYHSLAITGDGELWSWGRNNEGQLGRGTTLTREECIHPAKVQGLEGVEVKDAAGSGVVSMVIDAHGSLWAWGRSKRGQLGLGQDVVEAATPQLVKALSGQHIVQVSLGWGHALACTAEGSLYSWGYPAHGRLGYNKHLISNRADSVEEDMKNELNLVYQWKPHRVHLDDLKPVGVSCGFDHSLVLCENGVLLSFGENNYGQLGRRTETIESPPREWRVLILERVASVSAGLGHSLALVTHADKEDDTRAYSWGWNISNQLGRTDQGSETPILIQSLADVKVRSLDGGRVHSVAVDSVGGLWTWGSGKNGRLGLASIGDEQEPCLLENLQEDQQVQQAVCGMDHTLILVTEKPLHRV